VVGRLPFQYAEENPDDVALDDKTEVVIRELRNAVQGGAVRYVVDEIVSEGPTTLPREDVPGFSSGGSYVSAPGEQR